MAAALEPPVAGIMAKIQAHSTAKQINQIQDKPYVITQKQVQQQHFQKLKVRRQKEKEGKKSPLQSHNHFVRCTEDTEAVHSQSSGGTRLANRS